MRNTFIIITLLLAILLGACAQESDVHFARRAFQSLVQGRLHVRKMIDWANFKAIGVDIGATYAGISNIQDRANYQKSLITHLSRAFRRSGGRVGSFTDWRLYGRSAKGTVIACDYRAKGKTLLLTISSNNGQRKLLSLQWEQ